MNLSQLGQSLGISYHTVERYLKVLEQTFLVRRLPPYHRNVGKRLVKGWVLDQASDLTPLLANVECRGYAGAYDWLPEAPARSSKRSKR